MKHKKPKLVILSAPSGCGKDTIIEKVCEQIPNVGVSVSCTTRDPRHNKKKDRMEEEGIDYFFISEEEFAAKVKAGDFLEYARFNGEWYGTPRDYVENLYAQGNDVIILNIENQGAMQVKAMDPTAVSIFVLPPDAETLRRRLHDRKSETLEEIISRMVRNEEQVKNCYFFDYIVMNDQLDEAVQDVVHIIAAARRKTYLHKELIDQVIASFD